MRSKDFGEVHEKANRVGEQTSQSEPLGNSTIKTAVPPLRHKHICDQ